MYSGLHAMNNAIPESRHDPRMCILDTARPYAVKLLYIDGCEHQPSNLAILRGAGVSSFVLRLPDFRPQNPDPYQYARRCIAIILSFYNVGVRVFQVDNEPNWNWLRKPFGPWQYQYYMHLAVDFMRRGIPGDVVLVSPPLSYSSALWNVPNQYADFKLDHWREAFKFRNNGVRLYDRFQLAGATVYWQDPEQLEDPSYGDSYLPVHADSDKDVLVLEYAMDPPPGEPEETTELRRFREYPHWLRRAMASEIVAGGFAYIWYGTGDWERFFLTPRVARAIGLWRAVSPS